MMIPVKSVPHGERSSADLQVGGKCGFMYAAGTGEMRSPYAVAVTSNANERR